MGIDFVVAPKKSSKGNKLQRSGLLQGDQRMRRFELLFVIVKKNNKSHAKHVWLEKNRENNTFQRQLQI